MNIGELRNRIEIQTYVRVENEVGEQVKLWQPYVKLWAAFASNVVKDQAKAEKSVASIAYEIIIRHRSDIDTTMRVVYKGKNYNIDHVVNPKEKNVETHLFCTLSEEGVYNE